MKRPRHNSLTDHRLYDPNLYALMMGYMPPLVPWDVLTKMGVTEDDLIHQDKGTYYYSYLFKVQAMRSLEDYEPYEEDEEGEDHFMYTNPYRYLEHWHYGHFIDTTWILYELKITLYHY